MEYQLIGRRRKESRKQHRWFLLHGLDMGIESRYRFEDTRGVAEPRSGVYSPGAAPSHAYLRNSKRRQARLRVHWYTATLPPTRPTYSLDQNSLDVGSPLDVLWNESVVTASTTNSSGDLSNRASWFA